MDSFKDYLDQLLHEKLMIFGKSAYPKFNTVVILAGGAGSGKGFQLDKLIGVEGKVFDVDALKQLAINSERFAKKVKDETGQDLKSFNLKNPSDVGKLHDIVGEIYDIPKKVDKSLFMSVAASDPDRKPNLIFDVTLKNMTKLYNISRNLESVGYKKEDINIVWVVNDVVVAMKQNKERSRTVPEEILLDTHEGAALTMKKILDMGDDLKKYMDGDIYITFNKVNVDTGIKKSGKGGSFVDKADYIKVKSRGKSQLSSEEIDDVVYNKIKSYVPEVDTW